MLVGTETSYQARAQALALLSKIQSDTCTVGSDYGLPHVEEWAKHVARLIEEFWL